MDKNVVISRIKLLMGDPIVPLINEDSNAINNAIVAATQQYWINFPYINRQKIQVDGTVSPIYRTFTEIINDSFSDIEDEDLKKFMVDNSYVLGVVQLNDDQTLVGTGAYYINPIDTWITGIRGSTPNGVTFNDPAKMHQTMTNLKTMQRLFSGRVNVKVDSVKQRIQYTLPVGSIGSILVDYGLGLKITLGDEENEVDDNINGVLEKMDSNLLVIFTKMVARYYLEALLASRTSVSVTSDFNISVDFIRSKLTEIVADLKEEIPNASFQPMVMG